MRCRACDAPLSVAESRWIPEEMRHEDMCRVCRDTIAEPGDLPSFDDVLKSDDDVTDSSILNDIPE